METDFMYNSYLFAVIAMLCWGVSPIFAKLGLNQLEPLPALMIRSVFVSAVLVAAVCVAGKWQAVASAGVKDVVFVALEALFAALLGQFAYYAAIKYGEVGKTSLITAAAPLVALALAVLLLGEKISLWKMLGALFIVIGIILLKY